MDNMIKCSECDNEFDADCEGAGYGDKEYCSECWSKTAQFCYLCGEEHHVEEFSNIMFVPGNYSGQACLSQNRHLDNPGDRIPSGYYAFKIAKNLNLDPEDIAMFGRYEFRGIIFLRPPFGDRSEQDSDWWFEPEGGTFMICNSCKEKRFTKNSRWHVERDFDTEKACFRFGAHYYAYSLKHDFKMNLPGLSRAIVNRGVLMDGIKFATAFFYRRAEKKRSLFFQCWRCKQDAWHKQNDRGGFNCQNCGKSNYSPCHLKHFEAKKKRYDKESEGK